MKKIIIVTIALVSSVTTFAQQDAMFTHYMFNTLAMNPAYAGTRDAFTVTGLYRSQWTGFDGAPTTQTITMHSPLLDDKIGVGLSVINDKIGPINSTSFSGDFAYKLKVGSNEGKLAFGLKGGINLMQGDLNTVKIGETSDVAFINNIENKILPNFGFGVYYYTPQWYAGLSVPKLLGNKFNDNTSIGGTNLSSEQKHYFLIAGTEVILNESVKLKPTTFIKITSGAPLEADLTAMFIIQNKVEVGAMYRTADAAGILLGYNTANGLRFGYSFEWSFANLSPNDGSHEVMLRYDLIRKDSDKRKEKINVEPSESVEVKKNTEIGAAEKAKKEEEERLAKEKAAAESKLAAEKAKAEKLAKEKAEKEAKTKANAAEKAKKEEEERLAKEKAATESKLAAEKAEKEAKTKADAAEKATKKKVEYKDSGKARIRGRIKGESKIKSPRYF